MSRNLIIAVALFACVFAVFSPALNFGFLNFDDNDYLTQNPHVNAGLSAENVRWAFTSFHAANWHPLTWISHQADVSLFGMNPSRHHMVNILLHAANAVLVFVLFAALSGSAWRSAACALIFGCSALRVESVVWIAERKDVLCAFFWLLSLIFWASYVRKRGVFRYAASFACLALALLAKPMAVTAPFTMLLLDYWPLGRFRATPLRKLIIEKLPMFALVAASCAVTVVAQSAGGAVRTFEIVPMPARLLNALGAMFVYIRKLFIPADLAAIYPHPGVDVPQSEWIPGLIVLILMTTISIRFISRRYIAFGWMWYLATLIPVLGIVQVGNQAYADRYTYIPLVGIAAIICWALPDIASRIGNMQIRLALKISAAAMLGLMCVSAYAQCFYWKDDLALFARAIDVNERNPVAHANLASAIRMRSPDDRSALETAASHYERAIALAPNYLIARNNLGIVYMILGKRIEALEQFRAAVRISPDDAESQFNLADALLASGQVEEAKEHYFAGLRESPDDERANFNLGIISIEQGDRESAVRYFQKVIEINPSNMQARDALRELGAE